MSCITCCAEKRISGLGTKTGKFRPAAYSSWPPKWSIGSTTSRKIWQCWFSSRPRRVEFERTSMSYPIVPMPPDLWPAVCEIYREGIATGNATFETELPSWEKWDSSHRKNCRLIALEPRDEAVPEVLVPLDGAQVLGWAALSPVSGRLVYAGVAEVSVYVAAAARRRGVGRALLQSLVQESEANGFGRSESGGASVSWETLGKM